ncbi:fructosamine kinase family protein [Streptomyces cavernae]|uniref:fructosamine kinase family protein n=1 Tax=Streptomyces cavernae TaxID=2259034 RepID=UPI000FEB9890|nr:fructosamine kinase family protein [Streptomyces cavernae]
MQQRTPPPVPPAVAEWLRLTGHGQVTRSEELHGGSISSTTRITGASGSSWILKQSTDAPADLYRLEAAGLRQLASAGALPVPATLLCGERYLLLEDRGSHAFTRASWTHLGRGLARQHQVTSERFGHVTDNYIGRMVQRNTWSDDGHAFFAEHRLLCWLDAPACARALGRTNRARVERLAHRLPDLIPQQPAALLHGDLWHANVLPGLTGPPALCDPAVYYGWPEAELSMLYGCGAVPEEFTAAYQEISPLQDGWRERLPILHLRELLSVLAHFGGDGDTLRRITEVLDMYS